MKPKAHRTSFPFNNSCKDKDKHSLKKSGKICFAEKLETVHEVPYNYDIFKKSNLRLKLPHIELHKYTPLVCRDPYAKPSKKKPRHQFEDMFVSDVVNLPFIKLRTTDNFAKKMAPESKEKADSSNERQLPKPNKRTRASEKLQVGNTIHFKYSDFILRKMDRSTSSKQKLFIMK